MARRYIPNEDTTYVLFRNLRLDIFTSPRGGPQIYPNEDKTVGLFKTWDFYKSMCYVLGGPQIYPNEDKTACLFKNLRLEIFTSPRAMS